MSGHRASPSERPSNGNDYRVVGYHLGLLERSDTSFSVGIDLHQREVPMLGNMNRRFVSQARFGW